MATIGKFRPYNPGSGPTGPTFQTNNVFVAGIPMSGKGNIYSPNKASYRSNTTIRPGMETLTGGGSKAGLKFM